MQAIFIFLCISNSKEYRTLHKFSRSQVFSITVFILILFFIVSLMSYFLDKKKLNTLLMCITTLPLFACNPLSHSKAPVFIKNHPINVLVAKYQAENLPPSKMMKIDQMRIMHIDLDYVFDTDKEQQQRNIKALIARIQQIQPNTIFLQAFADPDANGSADQVYFKNRHIPTRNNLFPTVLSEIRQYTQVKQIYAWLPLIAWESPETESLQYVTHSQGASSGYIRISPFDQKNMNLVAEIFIDFIQNNPVDGILYHDDITLSDYEDNSQIAKKTYGSWGFKDLSILGQPQHPEQFKFAQYKTAYLDQFAAGISQILKKQQPHLLTARNMYAPVVLNPKSEQWFSQSQASTLVHYDYNAIMAMPYMEESTNHQQFYLDLIAQAKKYDPTLDRTIFELQAVNWRNNQKISTQELAKTMELLKQHGVKHFGYYPDDFVQQHPHASTLQSVFPADHSDHKP
ncbi:poly-beta-1,6-N-acetyl-D-glucosamine N-deacetylase PgaB [Acinetobacter sp. RF14B]|uniref:poly-beta-1,6-N-acetyl-D-glucosamine N-deacetylase PgaB n=1 Tax=Acinetobacter sp. RF14B TaxID=2650965 RepID=UPI001D0DAF51|nr:poly-beta-1,6-N-acetyl-D-glucosamine N-deacetylase PgaB [Acinetobacter sp. RF14B]